MSILDESTVKENTTDNCQASEARPIKPVELDRLIARIREVSTLPHIAVKVMAVANNPYTGAAELKAIVEKDPSLCARVLRTVNSSAYSLYSKITNLQQAISYLGCQQIRNLAVTASIQGFFKKQDDIGPYRREELWKHMVSVGICTRLIAIRQGLLNFEDAYLAGLMHDFGIIMEDQQIHGSFGAMIQSLDGRQSLEEVERAYLGFDHAILGSRIAEAWKFPPTVKAAIRFHHHSDKYHSDGDQIVRCVEVANFLCSAKGISSVGINLVTLSREVVAALSYTKADLEILMIDLDHEMQRYTDLFAV